MYAFKVRRNMRNELEARTDIDLGAERRVIEIRTGKGSGGGIYTSASVMQITDDGIGRQHAFGGPLDDFRKTLCINRGARATEKAIAAMHTEALAGIDSVIADALAWYAKPAFQVPA